MLIRRALSTGSIAIIFSLSIIAPIFGQSSTREYAPKSGQPGKDVVWVPNPDAMVQKMLDMAHITRDDYVVDLGSGDGRNVIAAAQRGARGRNCSASNRVPGWWPTISPSVIGAPTRSLPTSSIVSVFAPHVCGSSLPRLQGNGKCPKAS